MSTIFQNQDLDFRVNKADISQEIQKLSTLRQLKNENLISEGLNEENSNSKSINSLK